MGGSVALVCVCQSHFPASPEVKQEVVAALCGRFEKVYVTSDLCGLCAARHEVLSEVAENDSPLIVTCYERAIRSLFEFSGSPLSADAVCLNLRNDKDDQAELVSEINSHGKELETRAEPVTVEAEFADGWTPWYPVIDRTRCVGCGRCAEFCLFGTYSKDGKNVSVTSPSSCKLNCPACSRICPEVAIIFPKFNEEPLNGAEIVDEESQNVRVRQDVKKILGSDIYAALRRRRDRAEEKDSAESANEKKAAPLLRSDRLKALKEREAFLKRENEKDGK